MIERIEARLDDKALGWAGLALLLAAAAGITFWETRGQTLYADELSMFAAYREWDLETLFRSQSGHLIATSLAIYKAMWELFGADGDVPFRIYHVLLALVTATLFYLLARRPLGPVLALGPTALILFLGSGNEVTATSFGALAYIAIAIGLGVFLALDRDDRFGDVAACLLLLAGVASYSIILAFFAGAAAMIWLRGPERRRRSAWVVVLPALAYLLWRQFGGLGEGETNVTWENVGELPGSLFTLAAGGAASLTGLFRGPGEGVGFRLDWGYALVPLFAALVALRLRRGPPPSRLFWAYAATLAAFWVLVAVNLGPLREPDASRYQYISAGLMALIAAELLAPIRLRSLTAATAGIVLAGSLVANAVTLHQSAPGYRAAANQVRGAMTATEIAGPRADLNRPLFDLPELPVTRDLIFPASDYLAAVEEWGSPSWTEAELAESFETPRVIADEQLARLLGIAARPLTAADFRTIAARNSGVRSLQQTSPPLGPALPGRGCLALTPTGGAVDRELELVPGGVAVRSAGAPVELGLRRFASAPSVELATVAPSGAVAIAIPPDRSSRPWLLTVKSAGRVVACGTAP